uniref:CSON004963 protein n=1 Tax=Culicoides sonorensis TaxID=179676 RepID=A0A336MPT9_CULSO
MWLWCVRTKSWALANIFYEQLKEKFTLTCFDSPTNMLTAIRVFEGLILLICRSLETRNIAAIETAEAETRRFMFSFENILADKSFHVYRYLLLRAYYHQVVNYFKKYKLRRTTDVLEVIARSSFSSGQFYMYEVIHHHINSFQKKLPIEIENFWINFCSGHEGRQYSVEDWLKTGNKLFPFTLKIPELLD